MNDGNDDSNSQVAEANDRTGQSGPVIPRNFPAPSPSAKWNSRSNRIGMRRFQLEPDNRRESLAFFHKLNNGHADVSIDSIANEWNDNMNDPLIEHDEELPRNVQKFPQKRFPPAFRSSNLNATPLQIRKPTPFEAPSPTINYGSDLDDTLEMETTKPPQLSAPSMQQIQCLSPAKPFEQLSDSRREIRPPHGVHHDGIATSQIKSTVSSPGSPSNRKNRLILVPTGSRSPDTNRKDNLAQQVPQSRNSSKSFTLSTFGSPPKLQEREYSFGTSPYKRQSATTSHYPMTPTRHTVNIAATPSRLKEVIPIDSQEDEITLSPPRLDFENVLASYKSDESKGDSQGKSVQSVSQRSYSIDIIKPESHLTSDTQQEATSDSIEIPSSPGIDATPNSKDNTDNTQSPAPVSNPTTPKKFLRLDDLVSAPSIQKAKEFWATLTSASPLKESLALFSPSPSKSQKESSARLTRVTSTLHAGDDDLAEAQLPTEGINRKDKPEHTVQDDKLLRGLEKKDSDQHEVSSSKRLLSQLHDVQDQEKNEGQSSDKENAPAGLNAIKPFISRLPNFKELNDTVTRRHTDGYQRISTPERQPTNKPASKSVETKTSVNDWFASNNNSNDEKMRQSSQERLPLSERRSSRNLLEDFQSSKSTSTDDSTQEIIRKRGDFQLNRNVFEDSISKASTADKYKSDHATKNAGNDRSGSEVKDSSSKSSGRLLRRQISLYNPTPESLASDTEEEVPATREPTTIFKNPATPLLRRQSTVIDSTPTTLESDVQKDDDNHMEENSGKDGEIPDDSNPIPQMSNASTTPCRPPVSAHALKPTGSSLDSDQRKESNGDNSASLAKNPTFAKPVGRLLKREKTCRHIEGPSLESEDEAETHPEDTDDNECDDDNWLLPFTKNSGTYRPSPARQAVEPRSNDQFVSPQRPTRSAVPETPIPQTPKSAMLFAERKLTRGSGLDYASLPTPVKPPSSIRNKQFELAIHVNSGASMSSTQVTEANLTPEVIVHERVTTYQAEKKIIEEVSTLEPIDQLEEQNKPVDQLEVASAEGSSQNVITIVQSTEGTAPSVSNKRKLEDEELPRSVIRRTFSNTAPGQRRSRIPIATWRIEKQYKRKH